jgi:hypothetical protein
MSNDSLSQVAHAAAEEIAEQLGDAGAQAVILTGSWARGDAHPESDLDLRVVGDEKPKTLSRHGDFLVSQAWLPEDDHLGAFETPDEVGSIVPGWRSAKLLFDPDGIAERIQKEAEAWTWDRIDDAKADDHVAKELAKLAEEVHSLYSNLDQEIATGAAMQRSTIALETAPVMAVHHRLLYESEKKLWDLVSEQQGPRWEKAQEAALNENGEDFFESCIAAFDLFRMAAETARSTLDGDRLEVVEHALSLSPKKLR